MERGGRPGIRGGQSAEEHTAATAPPPPVCGVRASVNYATMPLKLTRFSISHHHRIVQTHFFANGNFYHHCNRNFRTHARINIKARCSRNLWILQSVELVDIRRFCMGPVFRTRTLLNSVKNKREDGVN